MVDEGHHRCYIQPIKPDEPSERYIYFDFETMQENSKHIANYVCAITQSSEECTAEGLDCVDRLVKHFRRPKLAYFKFYCTQFFRFRFFYIVGVFYEPRTSAKNYAPRM